MKIALIDDEKDARTTLNNFIQKYYQNTFEIIEAESVKAGIKLIQEEKPDLVFLDIHFNDGTGFDLLNALQKREFQLIFTTGYDQHAIKAFKYSAIDYLLKPIDPDDFIAAIQKIKQPIDIEDLHNRLTHLETLAAENAFQKMAFPSKDGTIFIEISDMVHLISDGNYTTVYTKNNQQVIVTRIIKEFEEMLPSSHFFRTHKSHIVNLKCINQFRRSDESVILSNGHEVPVARRRKEELMAIMA